MKKEFNVIVQAKNITMRYWFIMISILLLPMQCVYTMHLGHVSFLSGLICLHNGDSEKASHFFEEGAKIGCPCAMKAQADGYWSGDGVPCNGTRAILLYMKSADLGYSPAALSVWFILSRGENGLYNPSLAYTYLNAVRLNSKADPDMRSIAELEYKTWRCKAHTGARA